MTNVLTDECIQWKLSRIYFLKNIYLYMHYNFLKITFCKVLGVMNLDLPCDQPGISLVLVIFNGLSILISKMGSYPWGLGWNYLSIYFTHIVCQRPSTQHLLVYCHHPFSPPLHFFLFNTHQLSVSTAG